MATAFDLDAGFVGDLGLREAQGFGALGEAGENEIPVLRARKTMS